MTQIVVTVDNGVDTSFLQKVIENIKGVVRTSLRTSVKPESPTRDKDQWLDDLQELKASIDPSMIDMSDERTKYLLSK